MSNSVNNSYIGSTEYGYNTRGHLIYVANEIGGKVYNQHYSYSDTGLTGALANAKDGLPTRYTALGYVTDYSYDSLNRLTKRNVDLDNDIQTLYFYHASKRGDSYTTTRLSCENLDGTTYAYTYDNMGNITEIKKNGNNYRSYTYDDLGQLTKEIQYDNNKTINYVYNHLGNISYKTETITNSDTSNQAVKTIRYYYGDDNKTGWDYLLTGYDENNNETVDENEKISYDNIGNPITYRGAEMAWKGRQLTGYAKNGTMSTFSYDADGLRGSKTVGGVKTIYQYVGDKLFYEKRGDSQEFYYFYDSYGKLATIYYGYNNGTTTSRAIYHTLTNTQGDVVAIYNHTGALVARYEYDAWGNILSVKDASGNPITQQNHIANANPIRYRGYYYDADLGLYYLQSRYYDSETGRFINADNQTSGVGGDVLGYNMFAYCTNNPVNLSDGSGHWPSWATKLVAAVAVVAVVAAVAAVTVATAGAGTAIAAVAVGAAKGAAIGFAVGAASGVAIGYATTGTLEGTLNGMADGALSGSISGAITGGVNGYSNYSSAANFLKSNGANPKEVLSSYKGTPKVQTLKTDTTVYRTWGGTTQELGHWVSPNNYGSSARNLLSLPTGNTMTNTSSFLLPKGTTVLAGKAAPLFGQSGGGVQWWISVLG